MSKTSNIILLGVLTYQTCLTLSCISFWPIDIVPSGKVMGVKAPYALLRAILRGHTIFHTRAHVQKLDGQ